MDKNKKQIATKIAVRARAPATDSNAKKKRKSIFFHIMHGALGLEIYIYIYPETKSCVLELSSSSLGLASGALEPQI